MRGMANFIGLKATHSTQIIVIIHDNITLLVNWVFLIQIWQRTAFLQTNVFHAKAYFPEPLKAVRSDFGEEQMLPDPYSQFSGAKMQAFFRETTFYFSK